MLFAEQWVKVIWMFLKTLVLKLFFEDSGTRKITASLLLPQEFWFGRSGLPYLLISIPRLLPCHYAEKCCHKCCVHQSVRVSLADLKGVSAQCYSYESSIPSQDSVENSFLPFLFPPPSPILFLTIVFVHLDVKFSPLMAGMCLKILAWTSSLNWSN